MIPDFSFFHFLFDLFIQLILHVYYWAILHSFSMSMKHFKEFCISCFHFVFSSLGGKGCLILLFLRHFWHPVRSLYGFRRTLNGYQVTQSRTIMVQFSQKKCFRKILKGQKQFKKKINLHFHLLKPFKRFFNKLYWILYNLDSTMHLCSRNYDTTSCQIIVICFDLIYFH